MALPNARIPELKELSSASNNDLFAVYQANTGVTKYIRASNLIPASDDGNFEWLNLTSYALNDVVTYNGKWWQSLSGSNQGNIPIEGASWTEVSKPTVVVIKPWVSGSTFTSFYANVRVGFNIYGLKDTATLPFVSTVSPDSDPTNWELLGSSTAAGISVDDANFQVIKPPVNLQDYLDQNDRALLRERNSSVVFGLEVSNDATSVTFQPGEAQILNNSTPSSQTYKPYISLSPINIVVTDLVTPITYFYIDFADLQIKQTTIPITLEEQITKVLIGRAIVSGGVIIQSFSQKIYSQQLPLFIAALGRRLGRGRDQGLNFSVFDADSIAMSSGIFFSLEAATETDFGFKNFSTQSPVSFRYSLSTNFINTFRTDFNKSQYESGGSLVNATNGRWMTSLFYIFDSESILVLHPQNQYTSKTAAIENRLMVTVPDSFKQGALIGYIVYIKDGDFTNPAEAELFDVNIQSQSSAPSIGAGYLEIANSLSELIPTASTARTNLDVVQRPSPAALVDGAAIAFDLTSKYFELKTLTTTTTAITLTLSNVVSGANQILSINKNTASDVVITLAGTGLTFYGANNADYNTSPVITLSGALNDRFSISFLAVTVTDIEVIIANNLN